MSCRCDEPNMLFEREEPLPKGQRRKFYRCLNCDTEVAVLFDANNKPIKQRTEEAFNIADLFRRG
jgi:hypothetical protein